MSCPAARLPSPTSPFRATYRPRSVPPGLSAAAFVLWRDRLVESGFRAGRPIVAVAVETNDDAPQLARSAAAVFARWQQALA
ncbi:LmrA/YxaF family transcription factor [Streptomyces longwoodensis]